MARTFQNIRLFDNLSVEDNVKLGMHNQINYGMFSGIMRLPSYWKQERIAHERAMELLSVEVVDRLESAEGDAEVDALEHGGFVRVALGQQRRFTRNGDKLGFLLLRHILSHGQSSFSAARLGNIWGSLIAAAALTILPEATRSW